MVILKWFFSIPLFYIALLIINPVFVNISVWLYEFIFPINNVFGLIYLSLGLPLLFIIIPAIYAYIIGLMARIFPIYAVGARILLLMFTLTMIFFYFVSDKEMISNFRITEALYNILTFLVLYEMRKGDFTKNKQEIIG